MVVDAAKERPNSPTHKVTATKGQPGRNKQWNAKMKAKLRAALPNRPVQDDEHDKNVQKPNEHSKDMAKKSAGSNGPTEVRKKLPANGQNGQKKPEKHPNEDKNANDRQANATNASIGKHQQNVEVNKQKKQKKKNKKKQNSNVAMNVAMQHQENERNVAGEEVKKDVLEVSTAKTPTTKNKKNKSKTVGGSPVNSKASTSTAPSSNGSEVKSKKTEAPSKRSPPVQNDSSKHNKSATAAPSKTSKPSPAISSKQTDNKKRKIAASVHEPETTKIAPKRSKLANGFVESNLDDVEETERINQQLLMKKQKKVVVAAAAYDGPPVIVHSLPKNIHSSGNDSDSENDSYIDGFFDDATDIDGDDGDNGEEQSDDDNMDEMALDQYESADDFESDNDDDSIDSLGDDEDLSSDSYDGIDFFDEFAGEELSDEEVDSDEEGFSGEEVDSDEEELSDEEVDFDEEGLSGEEGDSDELDVYEEGLSGDEDSSDEDDSFDDSFDDGEEEEEEDEDVSDDGWEYSDDSMDDDDHSHCSSGCSGCGSDHSDSDSSGSEEASDDSYSYFQHGNRSYNSAEDSDYNDGNYDDLRIVSGTATTYKLADKHMDFFNGRKSQVIELSRSDSDDDECPTLVPIGINREKFLAAAAKQTALKDQHKSDTKTAAEAKDADYAQQLQTYYNMDNASKPVESTLNVTPKTPLILKCSKKDLKSDRLVIGDADADIDMNSDDDSIIFPNIQRKSCEISGVGNDIQPKTKRNRQIADKFATAQSVNVTRHSPNEELNNSHQSMDIDLNESNDFERSNQVVDEMPTVSKKVLVQKSQPKFFNAINSRHVLLLLRKVIYFHGNLNVTLLGGRATIFGYELQANKSVTVHSPRGNGLIFIEPQPSDGRNSLPALDALSADFFSNDIAAVRNEFDYKTDAVLLLERDMNNKGLLMIDRYMREMMLPNINAFNNAREFYSSEFVLHTTFSDRPAKGLTLKDEWSSIVLHKHSKLVTIGGKGVGKSTFVRYTINANLAKNPQFLFIDLDIGQPECFVPQTLSVQVLNEPILGPGYLRNVKPLKSVFFGDINAVPNPIKYLQCVTEIYKFCATNKECRNMPWLINTMGYSRGFGNELIACILKIFQPSDVVQIQSKDYLHNFDRIISADVVNAWKFNIFHTEMSSVQRPCNFRTHLFDAFDRDQANGKVEMKSSDHRYAMILSKLGDCLKSNSDWLSSVRPLEVSLNDLEIVLPASADVMDRSEYLDILNGNLVYLCNKQSDSAIVDCFGIGIVRSVDKTTDKLYLLPTIPLNEMSAVNALAIGTIPLPSAVLLNQHSQIRGTVPYVYNSDDFIGSKQVKQHQYRGIGHPKRK